MVKVMVTTATPSTTISRGGRDGVVEGTTSTNSSGGNNSLDFTKGSTSSRTSVKTPTSGKQRKRRSTKCQPHHPLFLAYLPLEELEGRKGDRHIGLILGAFLDLKSPQLTPEIYHLVNTEGVPAQLFKFWTHPVDHPANHDVNVLTIAKRSYNLLTLLGLNQTFVENLVETHIPTIMTLVVDIFLSPPVPHLTTPQSPGEFRNNFHHLQLGLRHLLEKQPKLVRQWLLSTKLTYTADGYPPIFGLLNHLHHPAVIPMITTLLFASVESLVSLASTLDNLAPYGLVELVWDRLWDVSTPFTPELLELILELIYEGGEVLESVRLLQFFNTRKFTQGIADVLVGSCPVRTRAMVDFMVGIGERVIVPEGRVRALTELTVGVLHSEIQQVWVAVSSLDYTSDPSLNHYHLDFIGLIVDATRMAPQGEYGKSFQPQLFEWMFDWVLRKPRCTIIHCQFLALLDQLGSSLVDAPHPLSSSQCFHHLLPRITPLLNSDPVLSPDLTVTLHLIPIILHAIYIGLTTRPTLTDDLRHLLTEIHRIPDYPVAPPSSYPPSLPSHLPFTQRILSPASSSSSPTPDHPLSSSSSPPIHSPPTSPLLV